MTEDNARINAQEEISDYTSSADFSEERARDEISRAERFIAACRPLLDRLW
jgi:hypothetical protein